MGKRKESHIEVVDDDDADDLPSPSSHKKHKKHKKKHKRRVEDDELTEATPAKTPLKLKLKIGSQSVGTKNVVAMNSDQSDSYVDVTDTQPWDGEDDIEVKDKKEASDDEEEWLTALEKGELDDYGEISRGSKDPSLMTARQRALKHGTQEQELLQLPTGYRQVELTEEQLKRREQRANKRKQMAQEKREKDKKQTIDRLLKKQESKLKGAKLRGGRKADTPKVTYLNNANSITISVPEGVQFPMLHQKADKAPTRPKCAVKGCRNDKKYSCSRTGVPLCSLQCYKKNLLVNKLCAPGVVTT